jgi:hypothetical protein
VNRRLLAALAFGGCVLPTPAELNARNCVHGVAQFDQMYCANVSQPDFYAAYQVEQRHATLVGMCPDQESQGRLAALQPCVDGYRGEIAKRAARGDSLRQRYAREIAELQADPAYMPARDRYRAARDDVEVTERDFEDRGRPSGTAYGRQLERKIADLRVAEDRLRALITLHGIEASHSGELGVW